MDTIGVLSLAVTTLAAIVIPAIGITIKMWADVQQLKAQRKNDGGDLHEIKADVRDVRERMIRLETMMTGGTPSVSGKP
jgi:hypothetical protein